MMKKAIAFVFAACSRRGAHGRQVRDIRLPWRGPAFACALQRLLRNAGRGRVPPLGQPRDDVDVQMRGRNSPSRIFVIDHSTASG